MSIFGKTVMMNQLIDELRQYLESSPLPPMIILDIINICNLRCVHCPQPQIQAQPNFKPRYMNWGHFAKIVHEIALFDKPCLLRLVGDGEPLLHPKLLDMVNYAKTHCSAVVNLTSNGLLLSPEKAHALADYGLDLIDFSIDALTKPVYERVRRGGIYEKLMHNIFYLLDYVRRNGLQTKVVVSFIPQEENADEVDEFHNFWDPLVDYVMIRSLHSAGGLVKEHESRFRNKAEKQKRYPCPHLWKRLTVDFEGTIKFCAHDWGSRAELANIEHTDLTSIWQGEALRNLRYQHVQGKLCEDSVCKECTDWASSRWDWGFERLVDKVVFGKPTLLPCLPLLE